MSIGAAVVGTGFGCRIHVPALRAAGFDVNVLVGQNEERTQRRAERLGIPHIELSYEAALERDDVQAVTIATPPNLHAPVAIAAAHAGKHVLCEKPFAFDRAEAQSMLDAAEAAGIVHLVGHEFRWAEDRVAVAAAIARGRIGVPAVASLISYVPLVADPSMKMPPWWYDVDAGGGWLGASGSHIVDQVRSWLGEFVSVRAIVQRTADRKEGADDTFTVFASLAGDVQCVMQQCAGAYGPMTGMTRVAGSAGSVWIDDDGPQYADKEGSSPLEIESAWKLPPPPPVSDDSRNRFSHLELGPYTRLCETFLARIEGRPDPTPIAPATFADGVASMAVIDAIRASAAHGGDLVAVV